MTDVGDFTLPEATGPPLVWSTQQGPGQSPQVFAGPHSTNPETRTHVENRKMLRFDVFLINTLNLIMQSQTHL